MIGHETGLGRKGAYFQVALNLPHAGRVARRIVRLIPERPAPSDADAAAAYRVAVALVELLDPCLDADENPPGPVAEALRERSAALGRRLVEHIERGGLGHDRLGQCVRNFFECLELGQEGAEISLRAGEDPKSLQRPA
jgi:hypothetical protein